MHIVGNDCHHALLTVHKDNTVMAISSIIHYEMYDYCVCHPHLNSEGLECSYASRNAVGGN